jgi:DnaK suppressor protein
MTVETAELHAVPPDEYLSSKDLHTLRSILLERGRVLMDSGREAVASMTDNRELEADAVDVATSEATREWTLRVAGRERHMLRKIRYALVRMDKGEYGACEECGEPISHRRLLARPVATHCIDCKTASEQMERRSRSF